MKKLSVLLVLMAFLGLSSFAMADSISPSSFTGSGPTGATYTVNKTVTINKGTPTTSLVDVFFLADTTGSMGGEIAAVKASAGAILSGAAILGNVQFGVGEYKDVGDSYVYRLNTAMTSVQATAQAGIDLWVADGGGDTPEANLYALQQVASDPATGWRTGSTKILVWFGDAVGHDPSVGITEAAATAALVGPPKIKVEAINVGNLDGLGQATRIATATGGAYYPDIDSDSIVATIQAAITSAFVNYSNVSLDTSEAPGAVGVSVVPGSYIGSYDRSIDRTFDFTVTFTDLVPGTHDFNIYATVDGGRVATEADSITSGAPVPEPATMMLLGSGLIGLAGFARKKIFKK